MDLTSSTTTYTIGTDTQTPPPTQPTKTTNTSKSLSFTNGTHNKHPHHPPTATPPPSQPPPSMVVYSYKECLKNHAASIGGHALDGCGEFMPSSSTNPSDPRSLKCAACGCHRNFHRRDPQEPPHSTYNNNHNNNPTFLTCFYSTTPSSVTPTAPPPQPPPPPPLPHRGMSQSTSPSLSTSPSHSPSPMSSSPSSPPPLSHLPPSSYHTSSAPHMLLALGNNAYSVDHEHHHHRNFNSSSVVMMKTHENNNNINNNNSSGKKRYRTKFSQEQKEKMYSFSEKLGWRMQKGDDGLVQEFCNDIGVPRGVFKVWMHNNKNTLRNKRSEVMGNNNAPQTDEKTNGSEDGNDVRGDDGAFVSSDINNPFNTNGSNNDIQRNEDSCVNVHVSVNGLSSS